MSHTASAATLAVSRTPLGSVYVRLNSGEVVEVSPATDVVLEGERIVVYCGEDLVASYRRDDVFNCSRTLSAPSFT